MSGSNGETIVAAPLPGGSTRSLSLNWTKTGITVNLACGLIFGLSRPGAAN